VTALHAVGYGLTAALVTAAVLAVVLPAIKRSHRGRNLAATFLAAAAILGAPQAALAASATIQGHTYYSSVDCPYVNGTISNNARPRMDTAASIDWTYKNQDCFDHGKQVLPGYLSARQDLAFWNGSAWIWCNIGPFVYNTTSAHTVFTGFGWTSPPCGVGYYYEEPGAFDYNGGWHGGFTFTNYIWVS
jgi:hypothetical protein